MRDEIKRGFTTEETAYYIGMSVDFLKQARVRGRTINGAQAPTFIKLGRCVRYLREDLDRFLDDQKKYLTLAEINKEKS